MKIAAYQAPLLKHGSMDALEHVKRQISICEKNNVEILCCPEAVLGGLADDIDQPLDIALQVNNGQLETFLSPLKSDTVSLIIGFTESTPSGTLYNAAAVFHKGKVIGVYRKVYPAINKSVYAPGDQLPTFVIGDLTFGIIICNDTNYLEPARIIAAQGAAALFIPTNNALLPHRINAMSKNLARNKHIARAVENGISVISADVAGHSGNYTSYGCTNIIDADGNVIASSKPLVEELLIADIEPQPHTYLRGWDTKRNPAVIQAFLKQYAPDTHNVPKT
jgi:predicted amidohydrolase